MIPGWNPVAQAALGTLLTWGLTAAGSALVFIFRSGKRKILDGSLGFAAGVMMAASYWSLLAPAIQMAQESGTYGETGTWAFVPVAIGFTLGAIFVFAADKLLPTLGVANPSTAFALEVGPKLVKDPLNVELDDVSQMSSREEGFIGSDQDSDPESSAAGLTINLTPRTRKRILSFDELASRNKIKPKTLAILKEQDYDSAAAIATISEHDASLLLGITMGQQGVLLAWAARLRDKTSRHHTISESSAADDGQAKLCQNGVREHPSIEPASVSIHCDVSPPSDAIATTSEAEGSAVVTTNPAQRRRTAQSNGDEGGGGGGFAESASSNALLDAAKEEKANELSRVSWRRILLLIVAITMHNIPEGLAVGVGFGAIGKTATATFENARNLAIGIGIQNFPEGLAVSLPLRGAGMPVWKCFWYGQLSGMVEPIAGIIGAAVVVVATPILPYALAFAAGAMIYVVVDDIIPEAQTSGNSILASWGAIVGFVVMMSLDVGLG